MGDAMDSAMIPPSGRAGDGFGAVGSRAVGRDGRAGLRFSPRWVSLIALILILPVVAYYAAQPQGSVAALRTFVLGLSAIWAFELITQHDWFRPRILVLSILSLYALPLPALLVFVPNVPVMASPAQVAQSSVVVLMAYLGLLVGDLVPLPRTLRAVVDRLAVRDSTIRAVFVVFVAVVLPLFVVEFIRLCGAGYFSLGRSERVGFASVHGVGIFFPAYSALTLLCLFCLAPVFDGRGVTYRLARNVLVSLLAFLMFVTVVWIESRYLLAVTLLGGMTVVHLRWRRVPKLVVMLVAVAATAAFMLMAFTRTDYRLSALSAFESFHPLRHAELRELHESTIYAATYLEERPLLYGATYANAYRVILPRMLVERPAELATNGKADLIRVDPTLWYSANKSYDRFSRGHHFGFSSTAEAYLNFGVAGPALVFGLFVFGLRSLHVEAGRSAFCLGLYAIAVGSTFWFIRSPVAYYVKDMLMFFLVPLYGLSAAVAVVRPMLRPS